MNTYYLSLCRGLRGYYVVFKANCADTVRKHAGEYFGRMWCSVYTEAYFNERIRGKYTPESIINADKPIELGDEWRWG